MFANAWASLRMGIDILPETDMDEVGYHPPVGYVPVYRLEVKAWDSEKWTHLRDVPLTKLDTEVEAMHYDYKAGVRITEDGHPVFSTWTV